MKIAIDLTSLAYNFSGIERYALSVTQELVKDKTKQFVLIFKDKVHPQLDNISDNVEYVVTKGNNKLLFYQIVLPRYLYKIKADYYFFPAFPAPVLFFNKNAISTIHDLGCIDFKQGNKWYMNLYFTILFWKAALSRKKIITVSEFSKGRIVELLNARPENVYVVHSGISDTFLNFTPDMEYEKLLRKEINLPERYILSLSTLEPRKNFRLLLDAYCELVQAGKLDKELVLVGRKGWLIDDLLSGLSEELLKHIHFTGFVEDKALPYIYRNADCFIFPTRYEGFGLPPVEAMFMETLVISSDAGSMKEVLGEHAILFASDHKSELKDKLCTFNCIDETEKTVLADKAKKWAAQYTFDVAAAQLLKEVFI